MQDSQSDPTPSDDEDIEPNCGEFFMGSVDYCLDPFVGSPITIDDCLDNYQVVAEIAFNQQGEPDESAFLYKYKKNQRVMISKCEFCSNRNLLRYACQCKRVFYCSPNCQKRDEYYHLDKCSARADAELRSSTFKPSENARMGIVGLMNIGNTCYMASSLQCLSNCVELTQYFLSNRFRKDINTNNVLGAEGRMAQAYGNLLNEMWF